MKACEICSQHCYGIQGYDGSCCSIEERNWIIGPHNDADAFIDRLSTKVGRQINKQDVFIDFEEGSQLFPNRGVWQLPESYPALRVDLSSPKKECIFYNTTIKSCMVYEIRPDTCQKFKCDFLMKQTKGTDI